MRQEIKDRIEKIRNGEVPEGYKEIKTCRVPRDWKVNKLKDFANIQTGPFGSLLHSKDYVENGTPIITVEHLKDNKIIHSNLPLVSDDDVVRLQKFKLMEGDVVFSRVGTIDRTGYVTNEESGWLFSGRCLRVRVNSATCAKYVSYCFSMESTKRDIRALAVGQTMPSLNTQILGAIAIRVPPFLEQQRIATILTTWDKAIELKEQLIEQKKEQKRGLMNKLLTGVVRLQGFESDWQEVKLSNLIKNKSIKTKENNQHPVLSCTKDGVVSQREHFNKQIASENNIGYKILKEGELVLSPMNLWLGGIDISNFKIGIVSPAYKVYEVDYKRVGRNYLRNLLRSEFMVSKYESISQKGASVVRRNLNIADFENLTIKVPTDVHEMEEIDSLVGTFSMEIELLEQELEALRLQKKGLMQLLLTGIVRVPN